MTDIKMSDIFLVVLEYVFGVRVTLSPDNGKPFSLCWNFPVTDSCCVKVITVASVILSLWWMSASVV